MSDEYRCEDRYEHRVIYSADPAKSMAVVGSEGFRLITALMYPGLSKKQRRFVLFLERTLVPDMTEADIAEVDPPATTQE